MLTVTKEFNFCAGHRLYRYNGKCSNVHGHNYKLLVTMAGKINKQDMVIDFSELKMRVQALINNWDHSLILNEFDPIGPMLHNTNPDLEINLIMGNPTAERLLEIFAKECSNLFKEENVSLVKMKLYETDTCFAEVSYV